MMCIYYPSLYFILQDLYTLNVKILEKKLKKTLSIKSILINTDV